MEKPKRVDLTQAEADALLDRVQKNQLTDSDRSLIAGVVRFMLWVQHRLLESKISIHRLKSLFGFGPSSEKKRS